jgi:lipopolysaccharide export system protein LptA
MNHPCPQATTPLATTLKVLILLFWLVALPAGAQSALVDVPVRITADEATLDDRSGTSTYTGNVVVIRGDMRLNADELTVFAPERRPLRIEAEGRPARAESPDPEGFPRIATARVIIYSFATDSLELQGEAAISTRTGQARGDRIQYDLAGDRIEVRGTPAERVEITFEPTEP